MANVFKPIGDSSQVQTNLHESISLTSSVTLAYNLENWKTYSHGMFTTVYDYPYLSSSANQLFDSTNNSESLRLAVNNTHRKGILFVHGDLLFNAEALNMDYTKSFVVVDTKGQMEKKEVGVTIEDNGIASIFSYGLECKWGQIAYITGKELRIARQIFSKFEPQHKKMLSFEILNKIIESGGVFKCHEPDGMILFEIDKIRKNI